MSWNIMTTGQHLKNPSQIPVAPVSQFLANNIFCYLPTTAWVKPMMDAAYAAAVEAGSSPEVAAGIATAVGHMAPMSGATCSWEQQMFSSHFADVFLTQILGQSEEIGTMTAAMWEDPANKALAMKVAFGMVSGMRTAALARVMYANRQVENGVQKSADGSVDYEVGEDFFPRKISTVGQHGVQKRLLLIPETKLSPKILGTNPKKPTEQYSSPPISPGNGRETQVGEDCRDHGSDERHLRHGYAVEHRSGGRLYESFRRHCYWCSPLCERGDSLRRCGEPSGPHVRPTQDPGIQRLSVRLWVRPEWVTILGQAWRRGFDALRFVGR